VARLAVSIAQLNAERTGRFPCAGAPQMIRRGPPNGSDPTQGTHPPRPPHRVAPTNPRLPTVTSGRRLLLEWTYGSSPARLGRGVRRVALSGGCPPVVQGCGSHLACDLPVTVARLWLQRGLPSSK